MKAFILLVLLLSACSNYYRCVDGKLYERIAATDAWMARNIECKELKP